jgi:hypothetical protein
MPAHCLSVTTHADATSHHSSARRCHRPPRSPRHALYPHCWPPTCRCQCSLSPLHHCSSAAQSHAEMPYHHHCLGCAKLMTSSLSPCLRAPWPSYDLPRSPQVTTAVRSGRKGASDRVQWHFVLPEHPGGATKTLTDEPAASTLCSSSHRHPPPQVTTASTTKGTSPWTAIFGQGSPPFLPPQAPG